MRHYALGAAAIAYRDAMRAIGQDMPYAIPVMVITRQFYAYYGLKARSAYSMTLTLRLTSTPDHAVV